MLMVVLIALPAAAADTRAPWVPREVPSPIPGDMCVRVIWPEGSKPWNEGELARYFEPPISFDDRTWLEEIRVRNLGVLKPCLPRDI